MKKKLIGRVIRIFFLYGVFAGFLFLYWGMYIFDPGQHETYFQGEDRIVEWLTFTFFLSASIVYFLTLKYRSAMSRKAVYYFILMGLFLFVCTGEEISWGQRIFGFETPGVISVINEQKEFNLHNLELEYIHPYGIVSWFMLIYGIILPLVFLKKLINPDSPMRKYFSPLVLIPCFAFSILIGSPDDFVTPSVINFFGPDNTVSYTMQSMELQEMYWGLCMFLTSVSIFRANRRLQQ